MSDAGEQIDRLVQIIARLRVECPWDARQTHQTLVKHLIEETAEVVDAIEDGSSEDLREELGDLLMQIVYHTQLAREDGQFELADVIQDLADKLVRRHPYVFADAPVPDDLNVSWEAGKKAEKHRASSLDGIATSLSTLARATKVIARVRHTELAVPLETASIDADQLGAQLLELVARGQANGVDADQALRAAVRELEAQVGALEAGSGTGLTHA